MRKTKVHENNTKLYCNKNIQIRCKPQNHHRCTKCDLIEIEIHNYLQQRCEKPVILFHRENTRNCIAPDVVNHKYNMNKLMKN